MCARAQSLMLDINGYDVKGSEGGGVWVSGGNGGGGGAVGHGGAVDDVGGAVDGVGGVGGHGHCAGVLCIYVYMDRYRVYIYI